eukprot:ANDGO_06677.mRNA.1 hypothetical protein
MPPRERRRVIQRPDGLVTRSSLQHKQSGTTNTVNNNSKHSNAPMVLKSGKDRKVRNAERQAENIAQVSVSRQARADTKRNLDNSNGSNNGKNAKVVSNPVSGLLSARGRLAQTKKDTKKKTDLASASSGSSSGSKSLSSRFNEIQKSRALNKQKDSSSVQNRVARGLLSSSAASSGRKQKQPKMPKIVMPGAK